MRTSLERSAALAKAARDRSWLEVETYLDAACEGLREIQNLRSNGDTSLAQVVIRNLETERQKIRDHRGAPAPTPELTSETTDGESVDREHLKTVKAAKEGEK